MRLFWISALALAGTPASARACTDDSAMRHYFLDRQPDARKMLDVLPVQILAIDGDVVRAKLDKRFAEALGADVVTIDLPEQPLDGNCINYGVTHGPTLVVVKQLIRGSAGETRVVAVAINAPIGTRRRDRVQLDSYIVDPAMKQAAAADGRAK